MCVFVFLCSGLFSHSSLGCSVICEYDIFYCHTSLILELYWKCGLYTVLSQIVNLVLLFSVKMQQISLGASLLAIEYVFFQQQSIT